MFLQVVIKVSDEGGGISRSNMERIWSYLYTTADPRVLDRMLGDDNGEIKVSIYVNTQAHAPINQFILFIFPDRNIPRTSTPPRRSQAWATVCQSLATTRAASTES